MKASPTVLFPFCYHHSQSDTFIFTLKSHTTQSIVILIPITPFLSISIHQCILIKSSIQFHSPLRLQPITHSPHSIHSNQYSLLLLDFKFTHFTHHLWQSQTTPSIPHLTTPINYLNPTNKARITKQPFTQESSTLTPTPQYSLPIPPSPHYPPLHLFSNTFFFMNETNMIWCKVVRNTSNNTI